MLFQLYNGPSLDFWWHLLWISKPEWAALFTLGGGTHITCSPRYTSSATHVHLLAASMPAKLISSMYLWTGISGTKSWDLSCRRWILYQLRCLANILLFIIMTRINMKLNERQMKPLLAFVIICLIIISEWPPLSRRLLWLGWIES